MLAPAKKLVRSPVTKFARLAACLRKLLMHRLIVCLTLHSSLACANSDRQVLCLIRHVKMPTLLSWPGVSPVSKFSCARTSSRSLRAAQLAQGSIFDVLAAAQVGTSRLEQWPFLAPSACARLLFMLPSARLLDVLSFPTARSCTGRSPNLLFGWRLAWSHVRCFGERLTHTFGPAAGKVTAVCARAENRAGHCWRSAIVLVRPDPSPADHS